MVEEKVQSDSSVLVEISVITPGGNGYHKDQVKNVQKTAKKNGLLQVKTNNGACIEGEWQEISEIIYACYEQVHEQSPQGYLKLAIR